MMMSEALFAALFGAIPARRAAQCRRMDRLRLHHGEPVAGAARSARLARPRGRGADGMMRGRRWRAIWPSDPATDGKTDPIPSACVPRALPGRGSDRARQAGGHRRAQGAEGRHRARRRVRRATVRPRRAARSSPTVSTRIPRLPRARSHRRGDRRARPPVRGEGRVEKHYWAVVQGGPAADEGTIDARRCASAMRRAAGGWWSITPTASPPRRSGVLGRGAGFAWLDMIPVTGRTHQLRIHAAHAGFPILGDPIYGQAARSGGPPASPRTGHRLHAGRPADRHHRPGAGSHARRARPVRLAARGGLIRGTGAGPNKPRRRTESGPNAMVILGWG